MDIVNPTALHSGSVADDFELNSAETVLNPDPMVGLAILYAKSSSNLFLLVSALLCCSSD